MRAGNELNLLTWCLVLRRRLPAYLGNEARRQASVYRLVPCTVVRVDVFPMFMPFTVPEQSI